MAESRPFNENAPLPRGLTLLEASAGTGKTWCMTTIWLRLVLDEGIPARRILTVTFTRAATSELLSRIRQRLTALRTYFSVQPAPEDAIADPLHQLATSGTLAIETILARIDAAFDDLEAGTITTIHGFCQRTLQQQQAETGVSPTDRPVDERDLIRDISDDFWALVTTGVTPQLFERLLRAKFNAAKVRILTEKCIAAPDAPIITISSDGEQIVAPPHAPDIDASAALRRAETVSDVIAALASFARSEMRVRADARGLLTFNDMLLRLADAVTDTGTGPPLIAALQRRFNAVLIDEFQDTDPLQWLIFSKVFATPDHHLVIIGDPKQAIYAFRQADIGTYLEAADNVGHHFTLNRNYRADSGLVRALNGVFGLPAGRMAFAAQGIRFEPADSTLPVSRVTPPLPPLRIGLVAPGAPANRLLKRPECEELIPSRIAADIAAFLAGDPPHHIADATDGRQRAVEASDCAVIVRTHRQAEGIRAALGARGLPCSLTTAKSVFATDEATDLLRILRAILLPQHVPWVRATLTTLLFQHSLHDLATREAAGDRLLATTAEYLRDLQQTWLVRGFHTAFRRLIADATTRIVATDDGPQRLANLHQLGELLQAAALEHGFSPPFLVNWLEARMREPANNAHGIRLLALHRGIHVVTVHGAKGLEYPFVWVPFGWVSPSVAQRQDEGIRIERDRRREHRVRIEIPPELAGLGGSDAPYGRPGGNPDSAGEALYEAAAEDLRILYVAMTRARHVCTLFFCNRFVQWHESALAGLLFADPPAGRVWDPVQQRQALRPLLTTSPEALAEKLRARFPAPLADVFMTDAPATIANAGPAPAQTGRRDEIPVQSITFAPAWTRATPLDDLWRRTSFSGIVRDFSDTPHGPAIDHTEQPAGDENTTDPTHDGGPDMTATAPDEETPALLDLPGSALLGNAIHRTLEHTDFQRADPAELEARCARELTLHGLDPSNAPIVAQSLSTVIATPLTSPAVPPFRLADLSPRNRLNELDFIFPVAGAEGGPATLQTTLDDIVAALRKAPAAHLDRWIRNLSTQPWNPLRGYLSGSIDLVFRHPGDGRVYIADWKSNRLGVKAADYGPANLLAAMDHHHYHLQYHLYAVALDRHMRHRSPTWNAERDFGGVFYFFLRGMHPRHAPNTGVFFTRPSAATIAALDAALTGGPQ